MAAASTTRLRLRVTPGARTAAIVGRHGGAWKVRVTAAAERGRANEAVLRLLADVLRVPREDLTLVWGHGSREKTVELAGMETALAERRLAAAAAPGRVRKDRRP
jgi:uncharacterized protein YggU (UPF0235/DUF167 family)